MSPTLVLYTCLTKCLSWLVLSYYISSGMCVNEWSPTCNSACTFDINRLQIQKHTHNNCFKVSHSCQGFSRCRQLRFVLDMEQYDADFLEHQVSERPLSMSFSGDNTIEVMAGFETRIIFGGESALLTPLDASDWDVIKAVTTPVIRAITKKFQKVYQSQVLE